MPKAARVFKTITTILFTICVCALLYTIGSLLHFSDYYAQIDTGKSVEFVIPKPTDLILSGFLGIITMIICLTQRKPHH